MDLSWLDRRYSDKRVLGEHGAYATVTCRDKSAHREVVLRVLDETSCTAGLKLAFLRSHEFQQMVDSPSIPRPGPLESEGEFLFFSREFVPGQPLLRDLSTDHDDHDLVRQLISTLLELHAKKQLHGNLRPTNVIVASGSNRLYLLDMGFWGHLSGCSRRSEDDFRIPESRCYDLSDPRADVYGFGLLCFELLFGHRENRQGLTKLTSPNRQEAEAWLASKEMLSPHFRKALLAATHQLPSRRAQSLSEIAEILAPVCGHHTLRSSTQLPSFDFLPEFSGRDDALSELDRCLNRSLKDGLGVLRLSGRPGVGKSRLLREFLSGCAARGINAVMISCRRKPLSPYCGVPDLLEAISKAKLDGGDKSLNSALQAIRMDAIKLLKQSSNRRDDLHQVYRAVGLGPSLEKAIRAVRQRIRGEFWVFIVDDAHNMLSPLRSILASLVKGLENQYASSRRGKSGLMLISCTSRFNRLGPDRHGSESYEMSADSFSTHRTAQYCMELRLKPLSEEAMQTAVVSVLGSRWPLAKLNSELYRAWKGNPRNTLLAAYILAQRRPLHRPITQDGAEELEAENGFGIPSDLDDLLKMLLSSLGPEGAAVLKKMSSFVGRVTLDFLRWATKTPNGISEIDLLSALGLTSWNPCCGEVLISLPTRDIGDVLLSQMSDEELAENMSLAADYWSANGRPDSRIAKSKSMYYKARFSGGVAGLRHLESLAGQFGLAGCYSRGVELLTEAIQLFEKGYEGSIRSPSRKQGVRIFCRRGDLYLSLSDYQAATDDYTKALELSRSLGSKKLECLCLTRMAEASRMKGDIHESLSLLEEARAIASKSHDSAGEIIATHAIGKVLWHQGKIEDSFQFMKAALQLADRAKDETQKPALLHNLGSVRWAQAKYDEALVYYKRSKDMCEKIGDEHQRAVTLNSLGSVHMDMSETARAMEYYAEALETFTRIGDRRNISTSLQNTACCSFWLGDFGLALERIEAAVSLKEEIGDVSGLAVALTTWGEILREMGDTDSAMRTHYQAVTLADKEEPSLIKDAIRLQIGFDHFGAGDKETSRHIINALLNESSQLSPSARATALRTLAAAHTDEGDYEEAIDLCEQALSVLAGSKRDVNIGLCYCTKASAELGAGQAKEARESLQQASQIAETLGTPLLRFMVYSGWGEYHNGTGNPNESYAAYSVAASLLDTIRATVPEQRRDAYDRERSVSRFLKQWGLVKQEHETPEELWEHTESPAPDLRTTIETSAGQLVLPEDVDEALHQTYDRILSQFITATRFPRACVALRTTEGKLRVVKSMDTAGGEFEPQLLKGPSAVCNRVNLSGEPMLLRGGGGDANWGKDLSLPGTVLCAPLVGNTGMLGVVYLDADDFAIAEGPRALEVVESMATMAACLIENALVRSKQDAMMTDLVERTRLLLGEKRGLPLLTPVPAVTEKSSHFPEIIGHSDRLLRVVTEAASIADTEVTVLVTGETGVGKELFAQAIHERSPRKGGPLVVINCGAIPRDLLESELFGFEKGAFTGAHKMKQGRLEFGNGGTIFLDEVGELSLDLQVKLLRFLETKSVERVGGHEQIPIDCRIIAATNRDLDKAAKQGAFREDLFYRLSVIYLHLPPIRDRDDDIMLLARHFLDMASEKHKRGRKVFSVEAVEEMMKYEWPGNVRELQNRVEKAVLLSSGKSIMSTDLGLSEKVESELTRLGEVKDQLELSHLRTALKASGGRVAQAAKILGLSRQNFYRLLKKHNLSLDVFRNGTAG